MPSEMQALQARLRAFGNRNRIRRAQGESYDQAISRAALENGWSDVTTADRRATYHALRDLIEQEQERVGAILAKGLENLQTLNRWLVGLGCKTTGTLSVARSMLKRFFINIYDLVDGHYERKHENLDELKKYTAKKKLYYPLEDAKTSLVRVFLKRLR